VQWDNEPGRWHEDRDRIVIAVEGDTDIWRVTRHDIVADDGHFYHREVDGDFTATVTVAGDSEAIRIRVERTGSAVELSFSRDGREYTTIRQGYLTDVETLQVGPMAAAPRGDGFEVH
jgi:hypothetical protein